MAQQCAPPDQTNCGQPNKQAATRRMVGLDRHGLKLVCNSVRSTIFAELFNDFNGQNGD
jgi:hypothetical protein